MFGITRLSFSLFYMCESLNKMTAHNWMVIWIVCLKGPERIERFHLSTWRSCQNSPEVVQKLESKFILISISFRFSFHFQCNVSVFFTAAYTFWTYRWLSVNCLYIGQTYSCSISTYLFDFHLSLVRTSNFSRASSAREVCIARNVINMTHAWVYIRNSSMAASIIQAT